MKSYNEIEWQFVIICVVASSCLVVELLCSPSPSLLFLSLSPFPVPARSFKEHCMLTSWGVFIVHCQHMCEMWPTVSSRFYFLYTVCNTIGQKICFYDKAFQLKPGDGMQCEKIAMMQSWWWRWWRWCAMI